jgi:hypothetical protein
MLHKYQSILIVTLIQSHLKVENSWLSSRTLANKLNQQCKIGFNYLFTKYLTNHKELHIHVINHNVITNYVIKENVPSGQNRYDSSLHKTKGLGLSERVGRLRNKGRSILCILNYRPFGKG